MGLSNAIQNRPVRVLGFLTAFNSIVYGIGYLFGIGGFDGALVGIAINSTMITAALGGGLALVGLLLMFAFIRQNPKTIRGVSIVQTLVWLFVTFMYLFNGAYLLALAIGLVWSVVSYYIAYASKNRQSILAYDQTDQARVSSIAAP